LAIWQLIYHNQSYAKLLYRNDVIIEKEGGTARNILESARPPLIKQREV